MRSLAGLVTAITGASSGIGAATALALASAGGRVVLGARREERLKELAKEIGPQAVAVRTDVRDPADAERLVATAVDCFGGLDALVVCAGIGRYGSILDYSDQQVREVVDTNITGTLWTVRTAVPELLRRRGDIVLIGSVAGLRGRADEAVYAATKHAQVGLAGSLDRELRCRGVRVSVLCPGAVASEFWNGAGRPTAALDSERMVQPEDIATAVVTVLRQPKTLRTLVWSMRSMGSDD